MIDKIENKLNSCDFDVSNVKKAIIYTLGYDTYIRIYEFFFDFINTDKYDFKIIETRRTFVLFRIFLRLFSYDYTIQHPNRNFLDDYRKKLHNIYSDCAIEIIDFKSGSKILLIDDILIHGRSLSSQLNRLYSIFRSQNLHKIEIHTAVMYKSSNAECISEKLSESLISNSSDSSKVNTLSLKYEQIEANEWKDLSNRVVNVIQQSGICYAAFVPQCISDSNKESMFNSLVCTIPKIAKTQYHSKMKIEIWNELTPKYSNIYRFMRKYIYKSNEVVYVPFVILPHYRTNDWECCYLKFIKKLSTLLDNGDIKILEKIIPTNVEIVKKFEGIKYTYRLVTYILSLLYGKLVEEEIKSRFAMNLDNSIYFTFGNNVGDAIIHIVNKLDYLTDDQAFIEDLFSCFDNNTNDTDFTCIAGDVFIEQIQLLLNNGNTVLTYEVTDNLIQLFISKIHEENEKMASHLVQRLQGVFLLSMIKELRDKFYPTLTQERYFLSTLISKWDNGEANYKIDILKNKSSFWVGGCVIDGEQAYHENLNADIFDEMNCFYEAYRKSGECLSDAIQEYKKMMKYAKDANILKIDDMEKILNYVEQNQSYSELCSLYPETFHSSAVKNCLLNY